MFLDINVVLSIWIITIHGRFMESKVDEIIEMFPV